MLVCVSEMIDSREIQSYDMYSAASTNVIYNMYIQRDMGDAVDHSKSNNHLPNKMI